MAGVYDKASMKLKALDSQGTVKGMHWIAVVQIVTDTAQYYTKHRLYYCDLSIYIIPSLTSFFFFSPKRDMANGHKETSLQQVTLACGDKPNGI